MIGGDLDIEEMCYAAAMAIPDLDCSPCVNFGETLPEFFAVFATVLGTWPIAYL